MEFAYLHEASGVVTSIFWHEPHYIDPLQKYLYPGDESLSEEE